jgi:hypothetical protein
MRVIDITITIDLIAHEIQTIKDSYEIVVSIFLFSSKRFLFVGD